MQTCYRITAGDDAVSKRIAILTRQDAQCRQTNCGVQHANKKSSHSPLPDANSLLLDADSALNGTDTTLHESDLAQRDAILNTPAAGWATCNAKSACFWRATEIFYVVILLTTVGQARTHGKSKPRLTRKITNKLQKRQYGVHTPRYGVARFVVGIMAEMRALGV